MSPEWIDPDPVFVADRIEDALDAGTVDAAARGQLLAALAELDADRARKRRDWTPSAGGTILGP